MLKKLFLFIFCLLSVNNVEAAEGDGLNATFGEIALYESSYRELMTNYMKSTCAQPEGERVITSQYPGSQITCKNGTGIVVTGIGSFTFNRGKMTSISKIINGTVSQVIELGGSVNKVHFEDRIGNKASVFINRVKPESTAINEISYARTLETIDPKNLRYAKGALLRYFNDYYYKMEEPKGISIITSLQNFMTNYDYRSRIVSYSQMKYRQQNQ